GEDGQISPGGRQLVARPRRIVVQVLIPYPQLPISPGPFRIPSRRGTAFATDGTFDDPVVPSKRRRTAEEGTFWGES
ncbi:MAG: hypothetical protein R6U98_26995, partial [Pirellulaceae bacterium]